MLDRSWQNAEGVCKWLLLFKGSELAPSFLKERDSHMLMIEVFVLQFVRVVLMRDNDSDLCRWKRELWSLNTPFPLPSEIDGLFACGLVPHETPTHCCGQLFKVGVR